MKFIKAGEIADSNIFNKLDERKKSLLEGGMDVINLSIGTPDFQPGKHVMEAVSRAALDPDMYKYSLNETRELLDAVENWYKRRYDVTLVTARADLKKLVQMGFLSLAEVGKKQVFSPVPHMGDVVFARSGRAALA